MTRVLTTPQIERDELAAIDAVLAAGGTWAQITEVLGLGSRQAARQHGQRLRDRVTQRLADQKTAPDTEAPAPPAAAGAPGSVRRQPRRSSRRRRRR